MSHCLENAKTRSVGGFLKRHGPVSMGTQSSAIPGLESKPCCLSAVWPWENPSPPPSLGPRFLLL